MCVSEGDEVKGEKNTTSRCYWEKEVPVHALVSLVMFGMFLLLF